MQTIDRRRFNTGLFLGFGLAGCAQVEPGLPDLIVTGLRWSADDGATWHTGPIQAGRNVWFEADVKNQGAAPTPGGVIIGVGFRANGVLVSWSDDHTTALPAGRTISLRANGGRDGDRYWNNAQAGSYTINVLVDGPNRIAESNESNNTLDVPVTVGAIPAPGEETIGSRAGGGNVLIHEATSHKVTELPILHCGRARVALHPNGYFQGRAPSPSNADAVVLALLNQGVKPYIHLEFHESYSGSNTPGRNYSDCFGIGSQFAARFKPNSTFLTGQGIKNIGATEWAAINEPDHAKGQTAGLTYAQYHAMLEGLADGIHSQDPTARVYPGGYLGANRDQNYTCHGFLSTVADLINDGTLAGFDLHTYHDKSFAPIFNTYNRSHQRDFERCIASSGITRVDIDWVCTEHNIKADPTASNQGYTQAEARNWFLTHFFDIYGVVRSDGTRPGGVRLAWQIWTMGNQMFYMASSVNPWAPRWCGHTYQMLLKLLHDMRFTFNDPKRTGVHKLKGGGKTAWVFQNIHSSWSTLFGNTFTINDIPAAATKVDVYDGNGLITTVRTPSLGIPQHTFSTPTGKSYLFIADAETPAPVVS